MMKWGRRKPSSPSPSHNSSISHIFPMSWLSKFKQKGSSSEHKPTKSKPNLACQSMPTPASWKDGQFNGGDDDSYWRLSFGEDRVEGEKSRGSLQSVRDDSDVELEFPLSSCQNCRPVATEEAGRDEMWKFNDVRKLREFTRNVEISPEIVTCNEVEKERESKEFKVPRRNAVKDEQLRKTSPRLLEEKREKLEIQSDRAEEMATVSGEKDTFELEQVRITQTTERGCQKATASGARKHCCVSSTNSRNSNLRTIEEDCAFEALNLVETDGLSEEKLSSELQKLKDMNIKRLMSRSEKQRKSVYISRELQRRTKQSGKVRVYSPRTAVRIECKIKALEDMKKAKMKMRKKTKEKAVEDRMAFDSFAVVKNSFNPQQDFRNSMIEMITEKGIRRPEELEKLLACYLTLNADEYHDLIIKVFRQVWFDLNQEYMDLSNRINTITMINHFLS